MDGYPIFGERCIGCKTLREELVDIVYGERGSHTIPLKPRKRDRNHLIPRTLCKQTLFEIDEGCGEGSAGMVVSAWRCGGLRYGNRLCS